MTPIDIALMTVVGLLFGMLAYFAHAASRDMRELQKWWSEYNAKMQEIDKRLNHTPGSREVAKRPRAEGDMSGLEERDNVIFLNTVNEEQR